MKTQSDINEKMRGILIDWLIEVHLKFKLLPETLYLTISTIDRYLSVADVHRSKLQLVGVTSMLIACKYEEIYPPEVRDFVYITDKAYTAEEVLEMEVSILNALEFNFTVPSILKFIDRYIKVLELDAKTYMTAKYLSELSLLDVKYLKSLPSRLAAAAVYLSVKINKNADANWNQDLCELSRLQEKDIRETAKILCSILKSYGSDKTSLQAVRKK
jgi:transcription initiation factor TFIIIB Brf1 subunit/transcription initiation factor TFIIB